MVDLWGFFFHRHPDHTVGRSQVEKLSYHWTSEYILCEILTKLINILWDGLNVSNINLIIEHNVLYRS